MLLILCGLAMLLTAILVRYSNVICTKLRLMDEPDDRKLHAQSTPLMGGLTLALVILPLSLLANGWLAAPGYAHPAAIYIGATFLVAFVGMADDRHALSANGRILLSAIIFATAALIEPLFNVRVLHFEITKPATELGLVFTPLAIFFTTLCCVGLVNAVNMADGKNGLVTGLCLGWLAMLATRAPAPLMPMIALLAAGLVILFINNLRGKLFLGDGGSYGFAAAIGLLTIATYNSVSPPYHHALAAEEAMLMFAVPVLDSFRLTFARMRRGQSPMAPDRDHLHHHMLDRFGWPLGLIIYLIIALLPLALLLWWRAAG